MKSNIKTNNIMFIIEVCIYSLFLILFAIMSILNNIPLFLANIIYIIS